MSIYADFYLYLQSKHDQNTTILLDRHGLEMLKMAGICDISATKQQNRVAKLSLFCFEGVRVKFFAEYFRRFLKKTVSLHPKK